MMTRFLKLARVFRVSKNPFAIVMVWLNVKKQCTASFKNGFKYSLDRQNWDDFMGHVNLFSLLPSAKLEKNNLTFTHKERLLRFDFGTYGFNTITEVFGEQPYKFFFSKTEIKNRQVVDVGAAFGDTAIAFLSEGAGQVFGYEAFPGYHKLAEENIKLNNFQDFCEIFNCAIGAKSGFIKIDERLVDMFGSGVSPVQVGCEVEMISLSDVVHKHSIKNGILKLDVEGYEYEILLNTPKEVLLSFSDIVVEYHYGYETLVKCLSEAGYNIQCDEPVAVFMRHLKDENARKMSVGNIYASLAR